MSSSTIFCRAWISNPLRATFIMPAGQAVTAAMAREITSAQSPILALGPRTGVIVRQLILRGVPQERIALVGGASSSSRMLSDQFPAAVTLEAHVEDLRWCDPFDGEKVGAVVSSLPLLSMRAWRVFAILYGAFRILRPGGAFYQLTYDWRCPVPSQVLDRIGLEATRTEQIFSNMPPAQVYRIVSLRS
jgi:phospholipid N-methyltransferase